VAGCLPAAGKPAAAENRCRQRAAAAAGLAGGGNNSLQLRQQAWVYHIALEKGEQINVQLHGPRAYLQSIHGTVHAVAQEQEKQALTCGDGAFIRDEANITLVADTPLRALLIDLPV
jgi:redox-sensitive bicupin YhaK (pirin superfamily)